MKTCWKTLVLMFCCALFGLVTGCTTFDVKRSARFVDMNGEFAYVDYGTGKHQRTLENGIKTTFNTKVRINAPQCSNIVCYQTLSVTGCLYETDDREWQFFEKGPYCLIYKNGKIIFEGFHCKK